MIRYLLCLVAVACATPKSSALKSDASLKNTYWKVMELHGRPVSVFENQREPYILLQLHEDRLVGSGGCNQLFGGYTLDRETLRLTGVGSTLMACAQGMEQEQALLQALGTITRYAIRQDTLRLYAGPDLMARLEARYMP
jgi:heat shock protein HslJ